MTKSLGEQAALVKEIISSHGIKPAASKSQDAPTILDECSSYGIYMY